MTLFWTTRDRAAPGCRHLLGCAAFLEQLAKRRLQSLQGMVVCLWFIPLELSEGRIYFFFFFGKFGVARAGAGNLQVVDRGMGSVFLVFLGLCWKPHTQFQVLRIQNAPPGGPRLPTLLCHSPRRKHPRRGPPIRK